jgi:Domain of unknown function (DUF4386)
MTNKTIEYSPQAYARTAGALYLLVILFGGFSEGFVMNTLIVSGDAAATAHNITAASGLWQLSVAADLIVPLIAVAQLWIEIFAVQTRKQKSFFAFRTFLHRVAFCCGHKQIVSFDGSACVRWCRLRKRI